jgi:hypothetical protein
LKTKSKCPQASDFGYQCQALREPSAERCLAFWRKESALETCPRITQLGESPELSNRGIGSNYPITKLLNYQI